MEQKLHQATSCEVTLPAIGSKTTTIYLWGKETDFEDVVDTSGVAAVAVVAAVAAAITSMVRCRVGGWIVTKYKCNGNAYIYIYSIYIVVYMFIIIQYFIEFNCILPKFIEPTKT